MSSRSECPLLRAQFGKHYSFSFSFWVLGNLQAGAAAGGCSLLFGCSMLQPWGFKLNISRQDKIDTRNMTAMFDFDCQHAICFRMTTASAQKHPTQCLILQMLYQSPDLRQATSISCTTAIITLVLKTMTMHVTAGAVLISAATVPGRDSRSSLTGLS
jgi:hypothetical protein